MKNDLTKLDILLLRAFQETEGPFSVLINKNTSKELTKNEILELSKDNSVISIELSKRNINRRWHNRSKKDRRND